DLGDVAERTDEPGREVVGVRGGEADPLDPVDLVDPLEQGGQIGGRVEIAPVGVDGLAEQGDLAAAGRGEAADLVDDDLGRVAALPAPGRRHDAEGAELLAALHDRDERLEALPTVGPGGDLDERALAGLEDRGAAPAAPLRPTPPP